MVELGTAVCVWASLFFALLIGVFSAESRRDLPLDHEMCSDNWVDPGDMLSADFSTSYEKGEKKQKVRNDKDAPAPVEIVRKDAPIEVPRGRNKQQKCDLPHFKQLTRVIIESFPTPGKRHATIELSNDDLQMLQEFKDDTEGEKISDVLQLVISIFKRINDDERLQQTFFTRILALVAYHKEIFAIVLIISILISILIIFQMRTTMPWYRQCWYLFGLLFMISVPWEWFRLYQKEYAAKEAQLIKDIPNSCATGNMDITERVSLWLTGLLSWKQDECIKYQEAILVDPMWEVSPSVALSTTATRLLFEPLRYIADSSGKSLNAFLQHVPTVWQPVMVVLITVIIFFCILLLTKSRIRFGFIEIGAPDTHVRKLEREEMNALKNCIRDEIKNVIHRKENIEELPRIRGGVQEEKLKGRHSGIAEATECSE